jgi:hypothetical protein
VSNLYYNAFSSKRKDRPLDRDRNEQMKRKKIKEKNQTTIRRDMSLIREKTKLAGSILRRPLSLVS